MADEAVQQPEVARNRRRRSSRKGRLGTAALVWLVTSLAIAVAGTFHVQRAVGRIESLDIKASGPSEVENYLLVGSDSREGADPDDPDYGGIGGTGSVSGLRSDTILVLRYDPRDRSSALLSIPRDLWVTVADNGKKGRINGAFDRANPTKRSQNMIDTVTKNLGLPIHHYVEVDFAGFKKLVDALGGVEVCFETPVRDKNTGLLIEQPGCVNLDGVAARQYVRSRYLERLEGDRWVTDGTADIGRSTRQREFIALALKSALARASDDPRVIGGLVKAMSGSVKRDAELDVLGLANQMRSLGSSEMQGYQLATSSTNIGGASVLLLDKAGSSATLSYFKGTGPPPPT